MIFPAKIVNHQFFQVNVRLAIIILIGYLSIISNLVAMLVLITAFKDNICLIINVNHAIQLVLHVKYMVLVFQMEILLSALNVKPLQRFHTYLIMHVYQTVPLAIIITLTHVKNVFKTAFSVALCMYALNVL